MKAGGAYVPIRHDDPSDRIDRIIRNAGISVILTTETAERNLPPDVKKIFLEQELGNDHPDAAAPPAQIRTDNTAYVLHTSGTTGEPIAVPIRHGSVVNLLIGLRKLVYERLGKGLNVTMNGPLTFDTSVKQIVQILDGHTLHIVPPEIRFDGTGLRSFFHENDIRVFDCTPSHLKALLETGAFDEPTPVTAVLVGGENIDDNLWKKLRRMDHIHFYNLYGPTECTVDAAGCRVSSETPCIGRPMSNTGIYILDEYLMPVPIGVAGEICIAGEGLSKGYLNNRELTDRKFVPNPFDETGGKLYKTGDTAKFLPDGSIRFLGRFDTQVKIRGYRIEISEIETTLAEHPLVRHSAVIPMGDPGNTQLAAYIVLSEEIRKAQDALRLWLSERLPGYMVPAFFTFMDAMPLTPNGKVDVKALPVPEFFDIRNAEHVPPGTATEILLARIWEDLLGIEGVGIRDNFFTIGGDSILSIMVAAKATKKGLPLTVRQIFEHQTIEELARHVAPVSLSDDGLEEADDAVSGTAASPAYMRVPTDVSAKRAPCMNSGFMDGQDIYPLSSKQLDIVLHNLREPESRAYFMQLLTDLEGALDAAALRQSWQRLVDRHPALRTFIISDGLAEPMQVVSASAKLPWKEYDWTQLSPDEKEGQFEAFLQNDKKKGFALNRPPLIRCTLFRLEPSLFKLVVSHHHCILDGWCLPVVYNEVRADYHSICTGEDPEIELSRPYRDYIEWTISRDEDAAKRFWRSELSGLNGTSYFSPLGEQGPHDPEYSEHEFSLTWDAGRKIRTAARERKTTLNILVQTVWTLFLWCYSGKEHIVFGSTVADRPADLDGAENMVGHFINTIPVHTKISPGMKLSTLITALSVGQASRSEYFHSRLVDIAKWCGIDKNRPIFDSLVLFQNLGSINSTLSCDDLAWNETSILGRNHYPLTLECFPGSERIKFSLIYNTLYFKESEIDGFVKLLIGLIGTVSAEPGDRKLENLGVERWTTG